MNSTTSSISIVNVAARIQELVDRDFTAQCAFLAELVKVPTDNPPGDCAAHAEKARTLLEALGFGVEVDTVPKADTHAIGMNSATNLIVRRRFSDAGPCIALKAHGDVVPPGLGWSKDPYGAEVVNDSTSGPTMYGRGVAVSKSDFATYTYALRVLEQLVTEGYPLKGSVELHFTYDEEVGGDIGPLRLLQQLEHLQKALWQHAVTSEAVRPASPLQFEIQQCTEEKVPVDGIPGTPSLLKQARERTYQKSGRPHDWRTREDPYEGLWDQITAWLTANPERTGVDLFQELQRLYPGRYRPTQVRTLQRGLQKIRARLLVTFDDHWGEEILNGQSPAPALRAEVVAEVS